MDIAEKLQAMGVENAAGMCYHGVNEVHACLYIGGVIAESTDELSVKLLAGLSESQASRVLPSLKRLRLRCSTATLGAGVQLPCAL